MFLYSGDKHWPHKTAKQSTAWKTQFLRQFVYNQVNLRRRGVPFPAAAGSFPPNSFCIGARGLLRPPAHFQLAAGSPGGAQATLLGRECRRMKENEGECRRMWENASFATPNTRGHGAHREAPARVTKAGTVARSLKRTRE